MDAATLTRRGVELQSLGRHPEAVQCFMQSLGMKIDDAFTHYRLGVSFRDCGMKLEAAECIRTALALRFDALVQDDQGAVLDAARLQALRESLDGSAGAGTTP